MSFNIAYVISISPPEAIDEYVRRVSSLKPETIVRTSSTAVISIWSPNTYDASVESMWDIIDNDIERISLTIPELGSQFPILDGRQVGNRWPIVFETDTSVPSGPEHVEIICSFDNALVSHASSELQAKLIRIVGFTLGRYRLLAECVRTCRKILAEINIADPNSQLPKELVDQFVGIRRNMIVSRVEIDARPDLHWGCEHALLGNLYREWSMDALENAATSSIDTTSTLWREHNERLSTIAEEKLALSSQRLSRTVLILTLFGGLSATSNLIEFAGSNSQFSWHLIPRGLMTIGLLATFAALLLVVWQLKANTPNQN